MLMYGIKVNGLSLESDKYGFVNENEVRISTGLAFILALFSFVIVVFKGAFNVAIFTIGLIWLDFFLKTIISPNLSIFGLIVRPFLRKKEKKWVGAIQKRFAWSIGLVLSTFVIFCILLLGQYVLVNSPEVLAAINSISVNISLNNLIVTPMNPAIAACLLCLIFMWLEAVVGFCVGCSIYKNFIEKGIVKGKENQNCADGSCEIKK